MEKIKTNLARCKGCFYCVAFCPKKAITPSKTGGTNGYPTVRVEVEKCSKCGNCYRICPDFVFEL